MFLGKNRFINQGLGLGETAGPGAGENTEFLNTAQNMPTGMQRFLAKKGITSSDDLANRAQTAPRMLFRKER